ncbi:MAG: 16S rRNA (cytidine(1402)-2'-O)-methyltransferase [Firmicutes bacterium]|nr:16S rRNA (cytidine(1402)-2'-O)-methyltransferase [Bacillota bacterium]
MEIKGNLFIVATPIGNLKDITTRAIETLKEVDIIAAEDTRHTRKLLNHFNISTPLTSYFEHNKRAKGENLLQKLNEGKNIALVSDAGMPAISDPGEDLVQLCIENEIDFTVIPGATAFSTALVLSGLSTKNFYFVGFLDVKKTARRKTLESLKSQPATLIFYEAPHKLLRTLEDMLSVFGDRNIAVCRELTKKFEQVIRAPISSIIAQFNEVKPIGEIVIVVQGAPNCETTVFEETAAQAVELLMQNSKMDKKTAIAQVALQRNIPKRDVYNEFEKEKGGK